MNFIHLLSDFYWWIKTGIKVKKLYEEMEQLLTSKYGWSSHKAFFVWKKVNKEIINMQLDGLLAREITEELDDKFKNIHS